MHSISYGLDDGGEGGGALELTAALPPAWSTWMPHFAASGWVQDTIPFVLWTTLRRLPYFANSLACAEWRDSLVRGMMKASDAGLSSAIAETGEYEGVDSIICMRLDAG